MAGRRKTKPDATASSDGEVGKASDRRPKAAADAAVEESPLEAADESADDAGDGPGEEVLVAELVDGTGDLPLGDDDERDAEVDVDLPEVIDEPTATKQRGLSRLDPLTIYLNDIRKYALLSREEEHEIAKQYATTGDVEAARRLVTANLRLVVKIAHEYRRAHKNLLDLIQEGNVGLVQAVKKYDPYRGVKLSSYAAWWIRAYILKFILNNWRLVKIGTTQAQRKLFFNLRKEREKLAQMGFAPTTEAIAKALSVPEREVIDMEKRLAAGDLSLDQPIGHDDDGGRTHLDLMEGMADDRPDVATEGREFRDLLSSKLAEFEKTLRGREVTIFKERLLTDQPKTLQEIGDHYGISRERARQLEQRLMGKLKIYLREELGDAVQIAMGLEE